MQWGQSLAEGPPMLAAVLAHLDAGHHWARPGGLVGAIAAVAAEVTQPRAKFLLLSRAAGPA